MSYFSSLTVKDGQTNKLVEVDSLGSLKTVQVVRLVGTSFENGVKDTNFWTESVTGSGSVTQDGEIILSTGVTADSTAKYYTNNRARKVTGTTMQFRAVGRQKETVPANCIRRAGAYDTQNGYFFQYTGTTFQVGSRRSGVDTLVSNGSFNGRAGATISADETQFTRLVIEYTSAGAKFFVDGVLIHTLSAASTSLTASLDLPITLEIINNSGNTTNNSYEVLFASIVRLGQLDTEAVSKFIGTNGNTICKYGAGRLTRLVNVDNAGAVTIYDNTAASGTVLAIIDTAKALGTLEFGIPFNTGLTVVTETGAKVVVVYE